MTFIAFDPLKQRLAEFETLLRTVFPDDRILSFTDPFYALQYYLNHDDEIEIVFFEARLWHITEIQAAEFVNRSNKGTKIYCTTDKKDGIDGAFFSGVLERPITAETLKELIKI